MDLIDFTSVAGAFDILGASWNPWLMIIPGILVGLIGGAMPGVSGTMTLALVLPFTLYMDFFTAIMFLTSVYTGAGYGGAVPAILVNMPGTPASAATAFDGFPMFSPDGTKLVFASNRNAKLPNETNVFIADWK